MQLERRGGWGVSESSNHAMNFGYVNNFTLLLPHFLRSVKCLKGASWASQESSLRWQMRRLSSRTMLQSCQELLQSSACWVLRHSHCLKLVCASGCSKEEISPSYYKWAFLARTFVNHALKMDWMRTKVGRVGSKSGQTRQNCMQGYFNSTKGQTKPNLAFWVGDARKVTSELTYSSSLI